MYIYCLNDGDIDSQDKDCTNMYWSGFVDMVGNCH